MKTRKYPFADRRDHVSRVFGQLCDGAADTARSRVCTDREHHARSALRKCPSRKASSRLFAGCRDDSTIARERHWTPACETYNAACGELTVLLRSSEGGRLWNQPLTLNGNNTTYHLRLEPAGSAVWAPNYFTTFESPDQIKENLIRKQNVQEGVGGALVGVRIVNPPEKFMPAKGITAPVTATLDFHATDATLALRRPAKQPMASVEGKTRPLAANFSAPINYYQPPGNLLLIGLMAGLRSSRYMDKTGFVFPAALRSRPNSPCLSCTAFSQPRSIGCKRSMDFKPTLKSVNIINSGSLAIRPAIPSSIPLFACAKSWPRSTNFIRTITAHTLLSVTVWAGCLLACR